MAGAFPRTLLDAERALVDFLLAEEFPGVRELRVQALGLEVRGLWRDLPTVVLLSVMDEDAPSAEVVHTVPVEARVKGADPPREVLLFVKGGRLDSIELVDYGGNEPPRLPAVDELEAPTVSAADAGIARRRPPRSASDPI